MLCLSRNVGQRLRIGENTYVTILDVKGKRVRLGIEAPKEVRILREELEAKGDGSDDAKI